MRSAVAIVSHLPFPTKNRYMNKTQSSPTHQSGWAVDLNFCLFVITSDEDLVKGHHIYILITTLHI